MGIKHFQTAIQFRKKTKIKFPDAIIIATAEKHSLDLITSDISDFQNLSKKIKILQPEMNIKW